MKKRPFQVVLLDNIEMAKPAEEDTPFEIPIYGRLSNEQGHDVDFTKILGYFYI